MPLIHIPTIIQSLELPPGKDRDYNKAEILNITILLSNFIPIKIINDIIPYEAFRKEIPNFSNFRVFNYAAYTIDYK